MNDEREMIDFLNTLDKEIDDIQEQEKRVAAKARLEKEMARYEGEDKVIRGQEFQESIAEMDEEETFYSGLHQLDNILGGFHPTQLVVLAAPTKSGKTQFCMELTIRMQEYMPLWLPFEESAEELIRKFMERGVDIPQCAAPKQMMGNTLAWVEKKIVEAKIKYGSRVVIIDHLHFLVPFNSERMDTRIGQTMRGLKKLAREHNVLIILIAHLKKTKLDIAPDLEDLRDSSFVAQEADTVMMLWRETERKDNRVTVTNNAVLSVQANRRTGETGNVEMTFKNGRYIEEDWKRDEETGICSACGHALDDF